MLPMQSFLSSFSNEVSSTFEEIKNISTKQLREESLRNRVRELALSWETFLSSNKVLLDFDSTKKIQQKLASVAQLSTKQSKKQDYYPHFNAIKKELTELVSAVNTQLALANTTPTTPTQLVPKIYDLPRELFPKGLVGWKQNIEDFLEKKPFDFNIFIITRYAKQTQPLIKAIKESIEAFQEGDIKFNPVIASDLTITDDLNNPIACLLCCRYGIVIFDSASENLPDINPNVAYELGFMHLLQRKCLLLKDSKLKSLNTDILHKLYTSYDSTEIAKLETQKWLQSLVKS